MTTKDIDPKIIDEIAHIQASDEGTAYGAQNHPVPWCVRSK